MSQGFSLIELMVVVVIVAALAYISAPMYSDYFNRAKIAQAIEVLKTLNQAAIATYNEEGIGDTFLYDGTIYNNVAQSFDYAPVTALEFFGPTETGTVNAWAFCVQVGELSFTDYVPNTAYSRICSKVRVSNGVFKQYCGRWSNNTTDVPVNQLPNECNCTSVSTDVC